MATTETLSKAISYEVAENLMQRVDLFFTDFSFKRTDFLGYSYRGSIGHNEGLTRIRTASHGNFLVIGKSPDDVIKQLWDIMTTEKMWTGGYGRYRAVIEWDREKQKFIKRSLTREEDDDVNGP